MRTFLLSMLFSVAALADCVAPVTPRSGRIEVGLTLENLMPSRLPGFEEALPSYGGVVSVPWGGHAVEVTALYGASGTLSVKVGEVGFRLNAETPHLSGYVFAGVHVLSYSSATVDSHTYFGGFTGLGASLPMGSAFALDLGLKTYFQVRPMVSMGGAFRVTL